MQQKYLFLCRETCRHVLYDGYTIVVQYIFLSPLYLLPNQSWLVLNQVLVIKRKQLIPSYLKQNRPVFLGKHHNNCHESFFSSRQFSKSFVSYVLYATKPKPISGGKVICRAHNYIRSVYTFEQLDLQRFSSGDFPRSLVDDDLWGIAHFHLTFFGSTVHVTVLPVIRRSIWSAPFILLSWTKIIQEKRVPGNYLNSIVWYSYR